MGIPNFFEGYRAPHWFRSVLFQTIIIGLVSFTQPGIWSALNNLGAGGQAEPYLINAANALTYGIMSFGCTLAGGLANKINVKWTLVLGVIFYTPYASSLYCNNRFGNEWYVLFGAALCGLGASMFWASEAAIAVGYPEASQRGKMVAIWMGLRNIGPLIGGAISLALNIKTNETGKVSYNTYLALIGLQCLGLPLALLLSPPSNVQRNDGTRVHYLQKTSWKHELKGIWQLFKSKRILLLIPIFIAGPRNYLTRYFTVRSRALASLLTAIVSIAGDLITGFALDYKPWNQAQRARLAWGFFAVTITGLWVWQTIVQVFYSRSPPKLDWEEGFVFNRGFAVYILWKFVYEALQTYLYWLMGTYDHGVGSLARTTGILRTWESVGSTFAYVVGATHWPYLNSEILSFALWLATIPTTTWAVSLIKPTPPTVAEAAEELDPPLPSGTTSFSDEKEREAADV